MIFNHRITTAANVTEDNRVRTLLPVARGLLYRIEWYFPSGSAGLLFARLRDASHPVSPANDESYFSGDSVLYGFDDIYIKDSPPYDFQLETYNSDVAFAHDIVLNLGMVSERQFRARYLPHLGWEDFMLEMRSLREDQDTTQDAITANILKQFEIAPPADG